MRKNTMGTHMMNASIVQRIKDHGEVKNGSSSQSGNPIRQWQQEYGNGMG